MWIVVTTTLPLFTVILAGYVAARRGLIEPAGIRGLTGFVFYFALPLMLFHLMATAPLAEQFDLRFVLLYLALALGTQHLLLLLARRVFGVSLGEGAIAGFASCFGNTVFLGLPTALAVFGPDAALPMALLIVVEGGIVMPVTVAWLEIARSRPGSALQAPLVAAKAVLRNPVVMAALLGAGAAIVELPLPALLLGLTEVLRGAAVPCALFALGGSLAGFVLSDRIGETATLVIVKLFIFPALVWFAMGFLPDLDPQWRLIALVGAALPMGANVFLLANQYQCYIARASTAVLVSTVVSVITVSALASFLAAD